MPDIDEMVFAMQFAMSPHQMAKAATNGALSSHRPEGQPASDVPGAQLIMGDPKLQYPALGVVLPSQVEKFPTDGGGVPSTQPTPAAADTTCVADPTTPSSNWGTLRLLTGNTVVFERDVWLGDLGHVKPLIHFFGRNFLDAVPQVGLQRGTTNFRAEFTTLSPTYDAPAELQLFARDPEELGQFFETLETDPAKVRQQIATSQHPEWSLLAHASDTLFGVGEFDITLPQALSILSPRSPEVVWAGKYGPVLWTNGRTTTRNSLSANDFFETLTPADPPDASVTTPDGLGSIKAARIVQTGLCTNQQWYSDILGGQININGLLSNALPCNRSGVSDVHVYSFTVTPVVRKESGQIFINVDAYAKLLGLFGCHVRASALYELLLNENGALVVRLAQVPHTNGPHPTTQHAQGGQSGGWDAIDDFGGLCGDIVPDLGVDSLINQMLTTIVRYRFNQTIREFTSLPPATLRGQVDKAFSSIFLSPMRWHCDPRSREDSPCATTAATDYYDPPSGFVNMDFEWWKYSNLGFGFLDPNSSPSDCCGTARQDVCNAIRVGFARKMHGQAISPIDAFTMVTTGPGCAHQVGDDCRLIKLLDAINAVDQNGRLRYWACESTDSGGPLSGNCGPYGATPCRADNDCSITSALGVKGACQHRFSGDCGADHPDDNNGCMPDPTLGYCMFTPPARRLVVNPDGIMLIFFDNENDWSNAALAAWYAIEGLSGVIPSIDTSLMCNYRRDPPGAWFPRRHFAFGVDNLAC